MSLVARHHADGYGRREKLISLAAILQFCAYRQHVGLRIRNASNDVDMPSHIVCALKRAGADTTRAKDIFHLITSRDGAGSLSEIDLLAAEVRATRLCVDRVSDARAIRQRRGSGSDDRGVDLLDD